ncbi:uncharacterized protein LOC127831889 [Dreissena polymorpha]|uniref:Uncharacterized protein n=1 Tax=Dreissena polymorpha TaxID=45954 RepID=A0A9D4H0Q4_DREPO|nr:uncharacterized protein LOC127831889 [Dreissena polymorpha]KAH3826463.1 hypothetical protein DPMN_128369 [Dreissena polymorpha]
MDEGVSWSTNSLQRSLVVAQKTYWRTVDRKVDWPGPLSQSKPAQEVENVNTCTPLEEAFAGVMQAMSMTTAQCKRFYRICLPRDHEQTARRHCSRFHGQTSVQSQYRIQVTRQDFSSGIKASTRTRHVDAASSLNHSQPFTGVRKMVDRQSDEL